LSDKESDMTVPTELIKKLQVKAGAKLWLINVPRAVAEALTSGAEVEVVPGGEGCTGVIAFCETPAEIGAFIAQVLEKLPEDGLLWLAYRKGNPAFNRDRGWDALGEHGLRPVRQVAVDEVWSALRLRPTALVKAKPGSRFAAAN
jgi:hypothetical protein